MTAPDQRLPRGTRRLAATAVAGLAIALAAGVAMVRPAIAPDPAPGPSPAVSPGAPHGSGSQLGGPLGVEVIPARDPQPWSAVDWREVPRAFGAAPDPALDRVDGIVAGGPGLIGWGRMQQQGRNQFNDVGAIYLSADGIGWTAVPIVDGVSRRDVSEFHLVADGPAGILVAGGVCCTDEERPALWRSAAGAPWQRLPWPDAFGQRPEILSLAANASGYVAGGTSASSAALWSSPDGVAWTRVDDPAAGLDEGGISDIERTADGLVAVGWQDVDGTSDGAVWTSTTGAEWRRLPVALLEGKLETRLDRIVAWAGGLFVLGLEGTHEERLACERAGRVASAARPEHAPAPAVDFSCGWGVETHWLTSDGREWQRDIPIGAQRGAIIPDGELIEFRLVAAGGPGLVVLGEGSKVGSAGIYVSADGTRWQAVGPAGVFPSGSLPNGFAVGGRTIATVVDGPRAWIGSVR
ncbi:MAG TPA: hypothetical protein VGQ89_06880 [Candidatus Limnocylindrales bacterium]|nr:hypothetical protein [Candidatus Limnocylindrales bacterium]